MHYRAGLYDFNRITEITARERYRVKLFMDAIDQSQKTLVNYFTIYDFVKAYEHLSDPEWDGEPADPVPPAPSRGGGDPKPDGGEDEPPRPQKLKIKLADGRERTIQHMTATTFWSVDGRPMSAAEFVTRLFGELPALFKDEDELRALWSQPDTRKALLDNLAEKGYGREQLREIERMIDAEKSDLYDVLAYIAFALSPMTRQERADTSRPFISAQYEPKLQAFLDFVLSQYVEEGVGELDQPKLPHLLELKYRAVSDAAVDLVGVSSIRSDFVGFQRHLYIAKPDNVKQLHCHGTLRRAL